MKKEVYTNVLFAKVGNSEILMELIKQFKPLLKKYAWKLGYEDAYEDLQLEFIKLIKEFPTETLSVKNDAGVVSYHLLHFPKRNTGISMIFHFLIWKMRTLPIK